STKFARGPLPNFKNYFVIYVDKPITVYHTYSDSTMTDSLELHDKHASAIIGFKTAAGEKVHMRVSSSFVSIEQADLNLKREQGNDSFDATEQKAKDVWNKTLNHLVVEGGTIDQKRTFYSCLYRMPSSPYKLYEIDVKGNRINYSPY